MSFPVTTGTFGDIVSGGVMLSWDTDNPTGDGPPEDNRRYIIDGLSASWSIDVLPPVATPSTLTFRVYMLEADDLGTWLPWGIGDPITVFANAYDPDDLGSIGLWNFKGRIADVAGTNHPAGGIVFNVICVDRLADLGSTNAPPSTTIEIPADFNDLYVLYQAFADDAGIDFDWHAGENTADLDWPTLNSTVDGLENVTSLDALSTAIMHDVRLGVARYLTTQIDSGTTDPEAVARFRLNEWDPEDVDDLAGVVAFHWTGSSWTLIEDPDYAGDGMVLWASQLARDVGTWRQTRDQAVNTVELTYWTDTHEQAVARSSFDDLVDLYGRNTRSVPSWLAPIYVDEMGEYLLLSRDQVQTEGYGFETLTVAYEALTSEQKVLWADELFNVFGTSPLGKPFAVVGIPDRWRLASGPIIMGRLMGVTMTLQAGVVRFTLTTRTVPPSAVDGVTIDDVSGFSPVMTFDNVDPTITIDSVALAGHSAI